MAAKYPAIPDPKATVESLQQTVMALKEAVEMLTSSRGGDDTTVLTNGDLGALLQSAGVTSLLQRVLSKNTESEVRELLGAGIGDMLKADNLAGLADKVTSRGNLDLVIGQHVQAFDSHLFSNIPLGNGGNIISSNYVCTIDDAQKLMLTQTNGLTITIPSNASVPYPVGTALTFCYFASGGITIPITGSGSTDYLYLAGQNVNGTRTLGAFGLATAIKLFTNYWIISGSNLS
jgi:hypothetical protein